MIRLFANARYDFIAFRKLAYILTGVFVVPGLVLLLVRNITYSIEFTGGTLMQIRTTEPVRAATLREVLVAGGVAGAEIKQFG
jgi:preprotein translocase subunit SecF